MVGRMCSVCRRKQTTARNEAGEVCCVGCGGLDGRGRPRGSAAACAEKVEPSASGSDDDAPDAPCAKTRGTIDFAGTKFTEHSEFCPVLFEREWADGCKCWALRIDAYLSLSCILWCSIALRNQLGSSQMLCAGSLWKRWREHLRRIVPWWSKVAEEVFCRCWMVSAGTGRNVLARFIGLFLERVLRWPWSRLWCGFCLNAYSATLEMQRCWLQIQSFLIIWWLRLRCGEARQQVWRGACLIWCNVLRHKPTT